MSGPWGSNDAYFNDVFSSSSNSVLIGSDVCRNGGGLSNTYIGTQTGLYTVGDANVFIGAESGKFNEVSTDNVFVGTGSGYSNNSASCSNNVFVGNYTGLSNTGKDNTFVGFKAGESNSTGSGAVIVGNYANLNAYDSIIAIGKDVDVTGTHAVRIGYGAGSCGNHSISLGYLTECDGENSVRLGTNAGSCGNYSISIGHLTQCSATGSISIGDQVNCTGNYSALIGHKAFCSGSASVRIGNHGDCSGGNAISIGDLATCMGNESISIGSNASCTQAHAVSIGAGSGSPGYGVSIGYGSSITTLHYCVAIGHSASVQTYNGDINSHYGTAIGSKAQSGGHSVAIGYHAKSKGTGDVTIGYAAGPSSSAGSNTIIGYSAGTNASSGCCIVGANSEVMPDFTITPWFFKIPLIFNALYDYVNGKRTGGNQNHTIARYQDTEYLDTDENDDEENFQSYIYNFRLAINHHHTNPKNITILKYNVKSTNVCILGPNWDIVRALPGSIFIGDAGTSSFSVDTPENRNVSVVIKVPTIDSVSISQDFSVSNSANWGINNGPEYKDNKGLSNLTAETEIGSRIKFDGKMYKRGGLLFTDTYGIVHCFNKGKGYKNYTDNRAGIGSPLPSPQTGNATDLHDEYSYKHSGEASTGDYGAWIETMTNFGGDEFAILHTYRIEARYLHICFARFTGDCTFHGTALFKGTVKNSSGTQEFVSDDRLKHNEKKLINCLEILDKLDPQIYDKGKEDDPDNWKIETGFIAQDVEQIPELSRLVSHADESKDGGFKDQRYLQYIPLITYNVGATQELHKIVKNEQTKVNEQEVKLTEQEVKLTEQEVKLSEQSTKIAQMETLIEQMNARLIALESN